MLATALLYYPLYPSEEFETPKAAALIMFGCFSLFAVHWRQFFHDRVGQLLALFIGSAAISTLFSIDQHMSVFGNPKLNNGLLVQISYLVLYLAASQSIRKTADRVNLIRIIVGVAAVVSVYAIAQVMGHDFKTWYGILYEHGYVRPMSTLGHPNFMAAYLAMVLPFVLWRFDDGQTVERVFMVIAGLLISVTILFSQSRGMWWAALFGIMGYQLMIKAQVKRLLMVALILVAAVGLSLGVSKAFRGSVLNRAEQVFAIGKARTEYLKGAVRVWKRYPVLGVGTDAFELGFQHQRTRHYWDMERGGSPHRAHNEFLNILATQGALGGIAAILLMLGILLAIRASSSPLVAPAAASIVAFYIQELSSFHVVATGALFVVCLSFLISEYQYGPRI